MKPFLARLKPAVDRRFLILLAGLLWTMAGILLLRYAYRWLFSEPTVQSYILGSFGFFCALWIHRFGFLRIVDKNLGRILLREGKQCVFSFMPLKSYFLVAVMMSMGMLLRHLPIPKPWLAVLYLAIGLSLILSSFRYLRVLIVSLRKSQEEQ